MERNDLSKYLIAVRDEIGLHHDESLAWCAEVLDEAAKLLRRRCKECEYWLPADEDYPLPVCRFHETSMRYTDYCTDWTG